MMISSEVKINDGVWEAWVTFQDETKLIHIGTKVPCEQNVALLVARINDGETDIWNKTTDYSTDENELELLRKLFL